MLVWGIKHTPAGRTAGISQHALKLVGNREPDIGPKLLVSHGYSLENFGTLQSFGSVRASDIGSTAVSSAKSYSRIGLIIVVTTFLWRVLGV